ncbi:MAG: GGDEF domain-containing protein, partial [Clostridia bacterium]|nr:GGDEF domain-containing protein [Clostridia bacterium]
MDWKTIVDQFDPMTCVISVEKAGDGGYGTIRIVTGNQSYVDSIATAAGGVDLENAQKKEFIPNSEYTRYIPKDLNFEEVCYRCAIQKQPMLNVVHMPRYPFDINAYLMPMRYEDERCAYCTYSQVFIPKTDTNLLAKDISLNTAMDVISTCVKLRGDKLFHDNMSEVVEDIRNICGADRCCVLLMDGRNRTCAILGEAKAPDSGLPWMRALIDDTFYQMAET